MSKNIDLYNAEPRYMYTNNARDDIPTNKLGHGGSYDGVWEGDLEKGRAKACPPNYQKKGNGFYRQGAYNWYIQRNNEIYQLLKLCVTACQSPCFLFNIFLWQNLLPQ